MIPQKYSGCSNPLGAAITDVLKLPPCQELVLMFDANGSVKVECTFSIDDGEMEHKIFDLIQGCTAEESTSDCDSH